MELRVGGSKPLKFDKRYFIFLFFFSPRELVLALEVVAGSSLLESEYLLEVDESLAEVVPVVIVATVGIFIFGVPLFRRTYLFDVQPLTGITAAAEAIFYSWRWEASAAA